MTIAVADRATAAPYSAPLPRSARPVAHTVLSAAGAELAQIWRTLKKDLCEPYRPELHYMRGPGPKWREKHANVSLPRNALALSLIPVADDASPACWCSPGGLLALMGSANRVLIIRTGSMSR
jgi:hypothetical protein